MTMQIAELPRTEARKACQPKLNSPRMSGTSAKPSTRRALRHKEHASESKKDVPTTIEVIWSSLGWDDVSRLNGYTFPPSVDFLRGNDFVAQLTGVLEDYLLEAQIILQKDNTPAKNIAELSKLTKSTLDLAERAVETSMQLSQDMHQYVHIHELSNNFLRTITVLFDRLLGYPEQLSSVTRPKKETLHLHPELCGLLECAHILDVSSTHQGPRIPYAPHRTGREITYEEIANLYRTSRVNIRRLEVDKCRSKLRTKLKNFYL
jgi:hypothetical protein